MTASSALMVVCNSFPWKASLIMALISTICVEPPTNTISSMTCFSIPADGSLDQFFNCHENIEVQGFEQRSVNCCMEVYFLKKKIDVDSFIFARSHSNRRRLKLLALVHTSFFCVLEKSRTKWLTRRLSTSITPKWALPSVDFTSYTSFVIFMILTPQVPAPTLSTNAQRARWYFRLSHRQSRQLSNH